MDYLDFDVVIEHEAGRDYRVRVVESPEGPAEGMLHFPFSQLQLENKLQKLQIALLSSGRGRRRVRSMEEEAVKELGRALFEALFNGELLRCYDKSRQAAGDQEKGLRIKLRINPSEMAVLPWEYLYDARSDDYLSYSLQTPIIRNPVSASTINTLPIEGPIRVLGMVASPCDLDWIDSQQERERLDRALQQLQKDGRVELQWLQGQGWRDLQAAMRHGPWHVLHFIGHGGFSSKRGQGTLALVDDEGGARHITAEQVGLLLRDHGSLRLAVLNACEGGRGNASDVFSSTAATLVRRGVPAVIAMQYEITDRAAIEFSNSFYGSLAEGMPVDSSVAEARKAIYIALENTVEWGTPALYMRSREGRLFEIAHQLGLRGRTTPAGSAVVRPSITGPSEERATGTFDVFLCHNGEDKSAVIEIAERLRERGIRVWLDAWEIRPGELWQMVLEAAIEQIKSAAVFVGKSGTGPWQNLEIRGFIQNFVSKGKPIIPVLLPDCLSDPAVPGFLSLFHRVDFRQSEPDPFEQLVWGITETRDQKQDKGVALCLAEEVRFTAYWPRAVQPEQTYRMLVFCHLAEKGPDSPTGERHPYDDVRHQAERRFAEPAAEFETTVTERSSKNLPRPETLTTVLELPELAFDPPRVVPVGTDSKSVQCAEFRLRAAAEMDGRTTSGRLSVYSGVVLVAEIDVQMRVDSQSAEEPESPARRTVEPYRRIFASFSPHDGAIVEQIERFADMLGDPYLRDVREAKAGQVWSEQIERLIHEAEIFQLFWSANSMRSENVRREYEFALALKRPQFVRPTFWGSALSRATWPASA